MSVLAQYAATGSVLTATSSDANVTAGTLTNGSLTSLAASSNHLYTSRPYIHCEPANGATSATLAVSSSSYFSFTVTAATGYRLDLSSLAFNVARGGASTPRGWVLRSSVDAYAANITTDTIASTQPTWTPVSVSLTASAFQALSAITFRIYSYTPGIAYTVEYDDLTLNGTAVSTASLKRWSGSAWVVEPIKTYVGGAWTVKPLKMWNGSAWATVTVETQVMAAPNITGLSSASGSVGSTVIITGTNFGATQGTSLVKFGSTVATVTP